MSMHKIVEKRRLLSDRRLKDEIVDLDRRKGSRRAIIEEFRRRMKERREQEIVVGVERRKDGDRRDG
jgi:hypothetical protein